MRELAATHEQTLLSQENDSMDLVKQGRITLLGLLSQLLSKMDSFVRINKN